MEYLHEATNILAQWHGGEYIELGYRAAADTGPFNNHGEPSYRAGEFVANEVINVWDYAEGKPRIPRTLDALQAEVDEHIDGEDEE
jgi:hypothetical protein